MTKKKVILSICALVLVCVISVSGTLAYLTSQSEPVTNTFVAADGGQLAKTFELDESEATRDDMTGLYNLNPATRVKGNTYEVLPGTTVKKDPTVHITGRTSVPAYLYVEVVSYSNDITYEMNDRGWQQLKVGGPHKGVVYVYSPDSNVLKDGEYGILDDDVIYVSPEFDGTSELELTFYAYMAQSTMGDQARANPGDVFTAAFLNN